MLKTPPQRGTKRPVSDEAEDEDDDVEIEIVDAPTTATASTAKKTDVFKPKADPSATRRSKDDDDANLFNMVERLIPAPQPIAQPAPPTANQQTDEYIAQINRIKALLETGQCDEMTERDLKAKSAMLAAMCATNVKRECLYAYGRYMVVIQT